MPKAGPAVRMLLAVACFAGLPLLPLDAAAASPVPASGEIHGREWTLLDPKGLALGGGGLDDEDVEDLHALGFRAILNYRAEHRDPEETIANLGMDFLYIPTSHAESSTMPLSDVLLAVEWIESRLADGKPIYVHCIAGNHRSAVGPTAYFMKTNGWTAEEAFAHVKALRPSVEPRWMDVLYAYEAHLTNGSKLDIDLHTPTWDVVAGETVPLVAQVTLHGVPVEGATVRYEPEYRDEMHEAITDANGTARFSFTAAEGSALQYVSATASQDGHVHGYDRNQYWVKTSKPGRPTLLSLSPLPATVEPGATLEIEARVMDKPGDGTNARLTLTTGCATLHRRYTGWDGHDTLTWTAPEHAGAYTYRLVAHRFPAEPVVHEFTLVVGNDTTPRSCDEPATSTLHPAPPDPEPVNATQPTPASPPPSPPDAAPSEAPRVHAATLLAVGVTVAALLGLALTRIAHHATQRPP